MTYFILFIATMLGMGLVARIKNDIIRAAIGIPMVVAMFCLGMMTLALVISAQWKPDRPDYEVLSSGNFYTTAHDMNTALSIALNTLEYNGAKMHSLNVNRKDIDTPLFNYFHRSSAPDQVYIVYVARTKAGYVIWFRYITDVTTEFEEEYAVLEYKKS
jgi:hypothetical protein